MEARGKMSKTIELTTAGWIINGTTLIPYNVNLKCERVQDK